MFGFLKAKEPEKYWGSFKERDHCVDCGNLQKGDHSGFSSICPSCGSREITKVVARWENSYSTYGLGGGMTSYHEYEIRED